MYALSSTDVCAVRNPVLMEVAVGAEQPGRRGKEEEKLSESQKNVDPAKGVMGTEDWD